MVCLSTPKNFHRKNGLQLPLDIKQILIWVLLASSIVLFFGFQIFMTEKKVSIFWGIIYGISLVIGVLLFVYATLCEHTLPPPASPDHRKWCRFCHEYVPEYAKHCRLCNKCRMGFDHHCQFVNNCVTISNYSEFFYGTLFLISAFVIALIHIFISGKDFRKNRDAILQRMSFYLHTNIDQVKFWIILGSSAFLHVGLIVPLTVLIVFHVYFQKINVSTFDYLSNRMSNIKPLKICGFRKSKKIYSQFK